MEEDSSKAGLPLKDVTGEEVLPRTVYSNLCDLHWTLTDATIKFEEIVQIRVEGKTEGRIREKVSVVLPWWQAKLLRDGLDELIAKYEKVNGELHRPNLP